jgi:hypothetical protein
MIKTLSAFVIRIVLSFLGDELTQLLRNRKLQNLAVKIVENTTGLDLDNDGKRRHASECLKADAKVIGVELKDRYANILTELALNKIKSK